MIRMLSLMSLLVLMAVPHLANAGQAIIADHTAVDGFDAIPAKYFDTIRADTRIYYGHTSHGSQIVSGLGMLEVEDAILYEPMTMAEVSDDLGHNGDVSWARYTRDYLALHTDCTMVMWSWCGGCSDNTDDGIDAYLQAMTALEIDYPDVVFVYMTGHLDGGGPTGTLYRNNDRIRAYCEANDKILYDFADIESWSPDGHHHPYETDACAWCADWCGEIDCPSGSCAHSHAYNCFRKGKAFWWLMAVVYGMKTPAVQDPALLRRPTRLGPAHPNPFNPSTTLEFTMMQPGTARIDVLDAAGRVVDTLANGYYAEGEYSVMWNGRDADGRSVPSGIYLTRIETAGTSQVQRMSLVK